MNTLVVALFVGVLYWFCYLEIPQFSMALQSPIILGFFIGLLYGQVEQGVILGAFLQAMYMGIFTAGNVLPSDKALATCVAVPIALASGLDATAAVAFAVPFGVLGAFLDNIRKTINSYWIAYGDKACATADLKKLSVAAIWGPIATNFVVRFIPVFVLTMLGATYAAGIVEAIPGWLMNGLSVAGGVLPAIGFATCVLTIGNRNLLPYFVIGFFLVKVLPMPTMTTAFFAAAAAFLHVQFTAQPALASDDDDEDDEDDDE